MIVPSDLSSQSALSHCLLVSEPVVAPESADQSWLRSVLTDRHGPACVVQKMAVLPAQVWVGHIVFVNDVDQFVAVLLLGEPCFVEDYHGGGALADERENLPLDHA